MEKARNNNKDTDLVDICSAMIRLQNKKCIFGVFFGQSYKGLIAVWEADLLLTFRTGCVS